MASRKVLPVGEILKHILVVAMVGIENQLGEVDKDQAMKDPAAFFWDNKKSKADTTMSMLKLSCLLVQ